MEAEPVHLGYVGRTLPRDEALDTRLSRLGGLPVWSETQSTSAKVQDPNFLKCALCGKPLALVGQFAVGYDAAPGRALFLLACPAPECSCNPVAWRALRSMSQPACRHQDTDTVAPDSGGYSQKAAVIDDWGATSSLVGDKEEWGLASSDDWGAGNMQDDWSTPKDSAKDDDWSVGCTLTADVPVDAEIESLLLARESVETARPEKVKTAKKSGSSIVANEEACDSAQWRGRCEPCHTSEAWPCVALEIYCEPTTEVSAGEYERELYERYLKGEEAQDDEKTLGPDTTIAPEVEADLKGKKEATAEADEMEMALEEEDAVELGVSSSGNVWFTRFQQRLERSPTQVVRYSWGGSPLWPARPPEKLLKGAWPPPCSHCGASRSFEIQLLPTLAYELQKAVPDFSHRGATEWGSVAVYTCSKDCAAVDFCEEFVVIQPAV